MGRPRKRGSWASCRQHNRRLFPKRKPRRVSFQWAARIYAISIGHARKSCPSARTFDIVRSISSPPPASLGGFRTPAAEYVRRRHGPASENLDRRRHPQSTVGQFRCVVWPKSRTGAAIIIPPANPNGVSYATEQEISKRVLGKISSRNFHMRCFDFNFE